MFTCSVESFGLLAPAGNGSVAVIRLLAPEDSVRN